MGDNRRRVLGKTRQGRERRRPGRGEARRHGEDSAGGRRARWAKLSRRGVREGGGPRVIEQRDTGVLDRE
jgi:hypothetical protein